MLRPTRLVLALSLLIAAAIPSVAHGKAVIGISENKPDMFTDQQFKDLGTKQVRVLVGWDVMSSKKAAGKAEKARFDLWMKGAKAGGYTVLLAFDKSKNGSKNPKPKQLVAQLKKLRKAYPGQIKQVSPWNEANLNKTPKQAAEWYKAVKKACKGCKIVADVLDKPNLVSWTKKFNKELGSSKVKIWGLHNYVDVNNFSTKRTRAFLKVTKKGDVWLTETGGVVGRNTINNSHFADSGVDHAAKATTFLFDNIVKKQPRIKKVYIYNWNNNAAPEYLTWDSALKDASGQLRPAYQIVLANR
ncbi:MAG TPA: hypothetical protein VNT22_03755 [Baekduia sp.]|nr:hypothetical protein [Baekduia sp.]